MGLYLHFLEKHGYSVRLGANGGLLLPKNMPEDFRVKVKAARAEIIAEIVVSNPRYANERHDHAEVTAAWTKLLDVAEAEGVTVWFNDQGNPRPAEPYCYVQTVRVGKAYQYWPVLRENEQDFFWIPAALEGIPAARTRGGVRFAADACADKRTSTAECQQSRLE